MIILEGKDALLNIVFNQLGNFWVNYNKDIIAESFDTALSGINLIFQNNKSKYIWKQNDEPTFTYYNSVQYSIFLYLLSNSVYKKRGAVKEADLLYYLNKSLNSCDWFYAIEFPEVFYCEHPIGSIMGRAVYGNRFFFYQGCTVGGQRVENGELCYPHIGENVLMFANSSIIGKSVIGDNVILSTDTTVRNENIPSDCIVFGKSPDIVIKKYDKDKIINMQNTNCGWA